MGHLYLAKNDSALALPTKRSAGVAAARLVTCEGSEKKLRAGPAVVQLAERATAACAVVT